MAAESRQLSALGARIGARRPLFAGAGLGAVAVAFSILVTQRSPEALAAIEADGADGADGAAARDAPGASPSLAGPSPSASAAAPAKRVLSTPDELDAADTPEKLAALAESFPDDPAVVKRVALSAATQNDHSAAIRAVRKLVRLTPAASADDAVQQIVLRAANGTPEVMELSLELMSEGMGAAGPDLLYTIAITDKMGKGPRERAEKLLQSEKVRALASPALAIALELRNTKNSCARKALFPQARDQGDARSLPYLTPLLATSGCGFLSTGDCLKCLGGRQDLREAISGIQAREKGGRP